MPLDGADTRLDGHAADAAAMTVLYVDDNPVNLMLVEAMLEGQPGLRVLGCPRPQDALMLARSQRPGVILLDIHMPGLNGYQVLARLQSEVALQGTPVVAVSADAAPAEIEAALAAGFAAYLTKPVDMQALIETVNRLRLT